MNHVLKVTTALHSSVSFGFLLKTRQVHMWIFFNMIMEINVWSLNKKPNKSVKLPFSVLKVSRVSCVQLSFFYMDWLQLQKSIAKFNFSVRCLRLLIFMSVPRGRSLWVEGNLISNFETCPSFGLYLILDKFPSLSSTDPSWSSNWIISVPNSNE